MKNHSLLNFLVFTCFLVFGYSVSSRFYQPDYGILHNTSRPVTTGSQYPIETLNNGQRSFLLIGTTALATSNPHLESIWLATYFSSDTTIRLLPIFPSGDNSPSVFEKQLNLSFGLNKKTGKLALDQDFTKLLENNNYWWSGYFIFDEVALTKIINLLGGIERNGNTLTGEQSVKEFPEVLEYPQDALSSQIAILQSVCRKFSGSSANLDMSQIVSLFPNHIFTSLDSNQLQTEMETLYSSSNYLTCRFPTLEISRSEP